MAHRVTHVDRVGWSQPALFPSGIVLVRLAIELDGPAGTAHIGWTVGPDSDPRGLAVGCHPCVRLADVEDATLVELRASLASGFKGLEPF